MLVPPCPIKYVKPIYRGYGTQVGGRKSTTQYCPPILWIGPPATAIVTVTTVTTVTTGGYPEGMGDGADL